MTSKNDVEGYIWTFVQIYGIKNMGRIPAPHAMSRVLMNQNLLILFRCWECSYIHHFGSSISLFISSMYFSINFCTYFCAFFPFLLGSANSITVSFLF